MNLNDFSNISAYSGGIYYSAPGNQGSSKLAFSQNNFSNVYVQERGAIFYVNDSGISASGNHFDNTTAKIAGPIVYSQNANLDISAFNSLNYFPSSDTVGSTQPVSFSPNFLDIEIISKNPFTIQEFSNSTFLVTNLTSTLSSHPIQGCSQVP